MEFLFKCSAQYVCNTLVRYKLELEREMPYLLAIMYSFVYKDTKNNVMAIFQ